MSNIKLVTTLIFSTAACDAENLSNEVQRTNSFEAADRIPHAQHMADLEEAQNVQTFLIEAEQEAPEGNLCFSQCGDEQEVFFLEEGEACGCGPSGLVVGPEEDLEGELFTPDELTAPSDPVSAVCSAVCGSGTCSVVTYSGLSLCSCTPLRCMKV